MFAFFLCTYLVEFLVILFMIFVENKRPYRVLMWTIVFLVLPFLSLILFLLFGCGVLNRRKKLYRISKINKINELNLKFNFNYIQNKYKNQTKLKKLLTFNANLHQTTSLFNEKIEIYRDGKLAFKNIFEEIKNARHSIFMSTYIFADDVIGEELLDLLVEKTKENVKVVLIYDSVGSKKTKDKFFDILRNNGGVVKRFFPPKLNINLYVNYRNHRKIIVIDEKISFVGGLNVRDDHLGNNKKLYPWLDTHLKIVGNTSGELLKVFLSDFKLTLTKKEEKKLNLIFDENYFNCIGKTIKNCKKTLSNVKNLKNCGKQINNFKYANFAITKKQDRNLVQVINSSSLFMSNKIEESFIFLINSAQKEIVIESPYLVLDDKFFCAIKCAVIRGVKVKVIISRKPDKLFVYNASLFYAQKLQEIGVQIFLFDGFVHSKTMFIDKEILVCGSSNFDMRSFTLNFETSVIVYDKILSSNFNKFLSETLHKSEELDFDFYKKLPVSKKLAIKFSKLFSPIL